MASLPTVLCVLGPTASGKTTLALRLTQCLASEIVSVDSAMVYRGLDIGTAKPDQLTLARVPHHLINIREPNTKYSAGEFYQDVHTAINAIIARGNLPIVVGGSMLYMQVLQRGLATLPSKHAALRDFLQDLPLSNDQLHDLVARLDPLAAQRIHRNDAYRLRRVLEVYALSGKQVSAHHQADAWAGAAHATFNFINITLLPTERKIIHHNIAQRFAQMLDDGLEEEVQHFYHLNDPRIENLLTTIINYREIWGYLAGSYSRAVMQERALAATRQLAKHQYTWLRRYYQHSYILSSDTNTAALLPAVLQYLHKHSV